MSNSYKRMEIYAVLMALKYDEWLVDHGGRPRPQDINTIKMWPEIKKHLESFISLDEFEEAYQKIIKCL